MANPLRYRINDLSGTCFDDFIQTSRSEIERRRRALMIEILNSVTPLDRASGIYAVKHLGMAGYNIGIDYEIDNIEAT